MTEFYDEFYDLPEGYVWAKISNGKLKIYKKGEIPK